jgi:cyanuric acid amidohydrolase
MTASAVDVFVLPSSAPDDTGEIAALFDSGRLSPEDVVCILGKTEGNGCVNDFSRGLAATAYRQLLADRLGTSPSDVEDEVLLMMSGGTEGVMTPHVTVFARSGSEPSEPTEEKRLAAGVAHTEPIPPSEIGRIGQVERTKDAVEAAIADANIASNRDVAYVQVKCPLLTADQIADADGSGTPLCVSESIESMAYSRGASALGVGVAANEFDLAEVSDDTICSDRSYCSTVASTSSGSELAHSEVLVLGNSAMATSNYRIGNAVMEDALDVTAVENAVESAAGEFATDGIVNIFAKAQASSSGTIRGRRHVIHDDSDIPSTRHARSVVSSVIGAVTGDPLAYVSGGAEHQGPDGGGPVAALLSVE